MARKRLAMYLRDGNGEWPGAGLAAGGAFGRAPAPSLSLPLAADHWAAIDWTPDLGAQIGTATWWRGIATCAGLCALAWMLAPGLRPLPGATPAPLVGEEREDARSLGIAPLGLGATTGRRMAATDLVAPLTQAPERPRIELNATLGQADAFAGALSRAGVGRADVAAAARLVGEAVPLADLAPGTRITLTLGRRPDRSVARPLEKLTMRARFDLDVSVDRIGGALAMARRPIAIDRAPLRLQGLVGSSLYRSVRAAGAPAGAVEDYLKAIATKVSIGRDIAAADRFDLVIDRERAATGETRLGRLQFAGIDRADSRTEMVRWSDGTGDSHEQWFDAHGEVRRQGFMGMPVDGRITSTFGWRMHPILGFLKMHKGLDIAAPWGSPIRAAIDGVVQFAGREGGYGNFVRLAHGGGIVTGYGHMSRFAVRPGERVSRGEVIGYVGSTGLSTGPHLHWEVWRNGESVNPRSISYDSVSALSGAAMARFKARVASLLAVRPGAR